MEKTVIGDFLIEESVSRSGKHRCASQILIYSKQFGVTPFTKASKYVVEETVVKPTYVKGWAKRVKLSVEKGDFIVYGWFVKNFRNVVKGYVSVYNHRGELVLRVKYDDGVVKFSKGNLVYFWLVKLFIETYRVKVREYRVGGLVAN